MLKGGSSCKNPRAAGYVATPLLTSTDKINGFYLMLHLWQQHVEIGNLEMFPLTQKQQNANNAALCKIIGKHLKTLEDKLSFYFSSACTEHFD